VKVRCVQFDLKRAELNSVLVVGEANAVTRDARIADTEPARLGATMHANLKPQELRHKRDAASNYDSSARLKMLADRQTGSTA
jgi:hypothetical protein